MRTRTMIAYALALALAALIAGCGSDGGSAGKTSEKEGQLPTSPTLRDKLETATKPTVGDFPAAGGQSLEQLAGSLTGTGTQVGLASSVFIPGTQRVAFGVIDEKAGFVYGKTAVYVADGGADAKARGPFLAPADLLVTDPAYASKQAATEEDPFAAVYAADVPLTRTGTTTVLVVTKLDNGDTIGGGTQIKVVPPAKDTVTAVGTPAPRVDTDTVDSAGGNIEAIETRQPPDSMHEVSLADVVGRKPVALLFATPQLCSSRVCGPVVDIAEQLKQTYGDRMTFIHQEVYKGNDPNKGLRAPLAAFGLQTEPWLFVIDKTGKIAARLEGSFGFAAFKRALEKGLA